MGEIGVPGALAWPLRVSMRSGSSAVVIALQGQLDLSTRALLTGEVVMALAQPASRPPAVIVDLSELVFCDSSGLSALIGARWRMEAAGGRLALAGARGMVERLLRRTCLDHVFDCHQTVADAEFALAAPSPA
ncbi:STAS domain-containing protein [Nonomuraea sp. bgisy101]|uniref:STAS domain-containing protein n=1 Tax=Nonomuraea sp. bgisy101 TaxID=3413784 RepID=UPI003D72FCBC